MRIEANPEDQLKRSVPAFVEAMGTNLQRNVSILSETPINDVGRPDLAIAVDGLLVGYIELKAPGVGTTKQDFRGQGHNLSQLKRFEQLPNLIYTDARDWTLYHKGNVRRSFNIRLGDIDQTGATELTEDDAGDFLELFREFLKWEPIVPRNPRDLAKVLAPLTGMIRRNVADAAAKSNSALAGIYEDWKRTLFPQATTDQFADSYAQTLTYGLLLAKLSGATTLDTEAAARSIRHHSSLLARTLEILTQEGTREELGPGLELLERTIEAVDPTAISSDGQDPWLYFYEDFLAEYDPQLREARGVYYTPAQVVKAQVTLVDELLRTNLGKPIGVADSDVTILDPATGTGTYLLRMLQHGIEKSSEIFGSGSAGSIASQMGNNLFGFELLVGPYAVAHLRLTQAVHEAGGREPRDGVHVYLTDTLESPNATNPLPHSQFERPLAEERENARQVKKKTKIIVCIGNPPYQREETNADEPTRHSVGSWIRFGDEKTQAPLESFVEPARQTGAGVHIKNLYNLYVYFWRWALWKVFESQDGPGIVSFITASSYLRGPGFVGMREEMRRTFDDLWIIDLEGDSLGTRTTENVFDIRTPVAIAIGIRYGTAQRDQPSEVHYTRITGTRAEKLSRLDSVRGFNDLEWSAGQSEWHQALMPHSAGDFFAWPPLADLFPWQHSGSQLKRSWPIGESPDVLSRRWKSLLSSSNRSTLFRETRDRKAFRTYPDQLGEHGTLPALTTLSLDAPVPSIDRYGFRSFDRQYVMRDSRVGDYFRPSLWRSLSTRQIFATTLFEFSFGGGTGVSFSSSVPDLHHFNGRGGKDVIPLYRDASATELNITQGLLELLSETYGHPVTPEALISYVAAILGHPGYTATFHDELEVPGPRIPLTKDASHFQHAATLGAQVIAWHTYAERFPEAIGTTQGLVPNGSARVKVPISHDPDLYPRSLQEVEYDPDTCELRVGGGVIKDVDPRIWAYEVSGLHVVRSWLGYRMKERAGRSSSPLDAIRPECWTWPMTRELLELLWVLEGVIALESAQTELLDEIIADELFSAEELPTPTDAQRAAPRVERMQQQTLF